MLREINKFLTIWNAAPNGKTMQLLVLVALAVIGVYVFKS